MSHDPYGRPLGTAPGEVKGPRIYGVRWSWGEIARLAAFSVLLPAGFYAAILLAFGFGL